MNRPVRLLHTSDLHLGAGAGLPGSERHPDGCWCPLSAVVEVAHRHRVDAVLVAGDLFDHQRVASDLVRSVLDRLGRLGRPCVLLAGNHDLHDERSLYRGPEIAASGVVFLDHPDGRSIDLLDGDLRIWGRAMVSHERRYRPLHGVPGRPQGPWWVVVGHGHHEPDGPDDPMGRSSPITPADIAATGAHYVALGHWHVHHDVSAGGGRRLLLRRPPRGGLDRHRQHRRPAPDVGGRHPGGAGGATARPMPHGRGVNVVRLRRRPPGPPPSQPRPRSAPCPRPGSRTAKTPRSTTVSTRARIPSPTARPVTASTICAVMMAPTASATSPATAATTPTRKPYVSPSSVPVSVKAQPRTANPIAPATTGSVLNPLTTTARARTHGGRVGRSAAGTTGSAMAGNPTSGRPWFARAMPCGPKQTDSPTRTWELRAIRSR